MIDQYIYPVLLFAIGSIAVFALAKFYIKHQLDYAGKETKVDLPNFDITAGHIVNASIVFLFTFLMLSFDACERSDLQRSREEIAKYKIQIQTYEEYKQAWVKEIREEELKKITTRLNLNIFDTIR